MSIKKRIISHIIIWIMIFSCPVLTAEELSFPDNNGKIIDRGEDYIIKLIETPNAGIKTAEALFLVKAKPEAVFKAVTDFDHYPEFMPNIISATNAGDNNGKKKYKFTLKVALLDINYTLLLKSDNKEDVYSLEWEYVEGDIKDTSGSWSIREYEKENNYSFVFYRVRTDPGRFVPDWVADRLTTRSIPDLIEAVRKRSNTKNFLRSKP